MIQRIEAARARASTLVKLSAACAFSAAALFSPAAVPCSVNAGYPYTLFCPNGYCGTGGWGGTPYNQRYVDYAIRLPASRLASYPGGQLTAVQVRLNNYSLLDVRVLVMGHGSPTNYGPVLYDQSIGTTTGFRTHTLTTPIPVGSGDLWVVIAARWAGAAWPVETSGNGVASADGHFFGWPCGPFCFSFAPTPFTNWAIDAIVTGPDPLPALAGPPQSQTGLAPITLAGNSPADGATGQWFYAGGPSGTIANPVNPASLFTPSSFGTYTLQWRRTLGFCSSSSFVSHSFSVPQNPPVAGNDAYFVPEDSALAVNAPGVLANDSDPDGGLLTATLVSSPAHGALTFFANGAFQYNPHGNYNGPDSFSYYVTDSTGLRSGNANVTLGVVPVNDAPVASNDVYNTDEDSALQVAGPGVLGNDNDVEGGTLSAELVSGPSSGSLGLNADGSFTFTPAPNANGPVTFTYRTTDGVASSNLAMVTIHVLPVNDATVAEMDAYGVDEDEELSVPAADGVLRNDVDIDSTSGMSVELVEPPARAIAFTLNSDGSFTYLPQADFNGVDTFTYVVNDNGLYSKTAMVNITVGAVNDPPRFDAIPDQAVDEDGTLAVAVTGVSAGPTNESGQVVTLTATSSNPAVVPHPTIAGTGAARTLSISPVADANGEVTITVVADDGQSEDASASRSFLVTVRSVNDPPVFDAIADQSVDEDGGAQVVPVTGVSPGPSDESSQPVTFTAVSSDPTIVPNPVVNGSGSSRSLSYAPLADANGEVTITLTADDGQPNGTHTRAFKINVNAKNDAPSFDAIADQAVDEDIGAQGVAITGVSVGPANESAQVIAFTAVSSNPAIVPHPVVTGAGGTRTLSYAPAADASGEVTITVTANDGQAANNTATRSFRIRVAAVNDMPVAASQAVATDEDTARVIVLSASDVDSAAVNFSVGSPAHGSLSALSPVSCAASGAGSTCTASLTYSPAPNYHGPDGFSFTTSDGTLGSTRGIVSIAVNAVNDLPVAANDAYATNEDTILNGGSVLENDSDVDAGDSKAAVLVSGTSNGMLSLNADGTFTYSPNANFNGSDGFTYKVRDGAGGESNVASVAISVAAVNDIPASVAVGVAPASIDENGLVTLDGSFVDPDTGDSHRVTIDWGDGTQSTLELAPGAFAFSVTHQYPDDNAADSYGISIVVGDAGGASARVTANVAVANVAPVVTSVTGPTMPIAAGSAATVRLDFADAGPRDAHTCTFSWDDGTPETVVNANAGQCSASHVYGASNVHEVLVTVADDDGGSTTESFRYVVVYDAAAGFVTGGGWISSPAGAYAPNPAVAGKATFGFVSKYKAGSSVPSGNTEFQFKAASLNFKSSVYEWMVISGAKVRYRGIGEVNGIPGFGFELTAWDGNMPGGGGVDRLRLKIWDQNRGNAVLYDNQMGAEDGDDPTTALVGGSIVIHK